MLHTTQRTTYIGTQQSRPRDTTHTYTDVERLLHKHKGFQHNTSSTRLSVGSLTTPLIPATYSE